MFIIQSRIIIIIRRRRGGGGRRGGGEGGRRGGGEGGREEEVLLGEVILIWLYIKYHQGIICMTRSGSENCIGLFTLKLKDSNKLNN